MTGDGLAHLTLECLEPLTLLQAFGADRGTAINGDGFALVALDAGVSTRHGDPRPRSDDHRRRRPHRPRRHGLHEAGPH